MDDIFFNLQHELFYLVCIQIAKNRYSGDLGIMLLEFDKTKLSYAYKKKIKSEEVNKIKGIKVKEDISLVKS